MQAPDLSGSRIDAMISLNDPLAVLATRLQCEQIEVSVAVKFERNERPGLLSAGRVSDMA